MKCHGTYLIHDDDLKILWMGSGRNRRGCGMCGEELETEVLKTEALCSGSDSE